MRSEVSLIGDELVHAHDLSITFGNI
jgi:hypothetical protein